MADHRSALVAGNTITQKTPRQKSIPSKPTPAPTRPRGPILTHSMATQKRIAASRQNGAKSRGPVTDLGKERSSRNALRHGLLSRTVVLDDEDPKQFKALLDQHVAKFQPNGDIEHQTVEEMAVCQWKLRRLNIIETTLLDDYSSDHGYTDDAELSIAEAFQARQRTLANLERYSARLTRQYYRAFRHLQELRQPDGSGSFGKKEIPVPPPPPPTPIQAVPRPQPAPVDPKTRPIAVLRPNSVPKVKEEQRK